MKTTAVARLKAQLSKYLRLVKAGEEILTTEREVPVAKIVPIRNGAGDLESLRDLQVDWHAPQALVTGHGAGCRLVSQG